MLIGLTGLPGSGKDTIANLLLADGFRHYAFAWPIKLALSTMFSWDPALWEDREWKERPIPWLNNQSPRDLSKTLGTDWGRDMIDWDLWLDLGEVRVRQACRDGASMVISDVRFENEARMIIDNGGIIVSVLSDQADEPSEHVSDAGIPIDLITCGILNNGPFDGDSMDSLIDQVDALVLRNAPSESGRTILDAGSGAAGDILPS